LTLKQNKIMFYNEFREKFAKKLGIDIDKAEEIISAFTFTIYDALAENDYLRINNLISLKYSTKIQKQYYSPTKQEFVPTQKKFKVVVKLSGSLESYIEAQRAKNKTT